jgi:hypothetical protein
MIEGVGETLLNLFETQEITASPPRVRRQRGLIQRLTQTVTTRSDDGTQSDRN